MYNPTIIANYFIEKSLKNNLGISPMKLIKLVYIAHGWYLSAKESPLLTENIEAWKYGPVISSLYQQVKKYANNSIPRVLPVDKEYNQSIKEEDKKILDVVFDIYASNFDGLQLSTMTHFKNTPWEKTWNKNKQHSQIDDQMIMNFYKSKNNKEDCKLGL